MSSRSVLPGGKTRRLGRSLLGLYHLTCVQPVSASQAFGRFYWILSSPSSVIALASLSRFRSEEAARANRDDIVDQEL